MTAVQLTPQNLIEAPLHGIRKSAAQPNRTSGPSLQGPISLLPLIRWSSFEKEVRDTTTLIHRHRPALFVNSVLSSMLDQNSNASMSRHCLEKEQLLCSEEKGIEGRLYHNALHVVSGVIKHLCLIDPHSQQATPMEIGSARALGSATYQDDDGNTLRTSQPDIAIMDENYNLLCTG